MRGVENDRLLATAGVVDSRLALVIAFPVCIAQSELPTSITQATIRAKMGVITEMNT